ncbi:hypothetical protein [Sporosarcina sp. P17b]|uniref:hypothetical protein n=1 Tax=Sporosarcina sp. P17b TaxID=2048260 RepID=UPI000C1709B7|nr:hypothetical protein [Sporosarcina sp. P17b]PIC73358.1 hypothetical protein CSV76_11110 [Sporosarcina sp. P17b]
MTSNKICLYTKQPFDDANMKSGDHIFIAAIGGKKKLPKDYVSHEANNYFSKLEKHFSRDSFISIIRQFEGPGKRGKIHENKASKSNICVISNNNEAGNEKFSLGYIKLGKPYVINHFIFTFDKEDMNISLDPTLIDKDSSHEQAIQNLITEVKKHSKYTLIFSRVLPNNLALFGVSDNQWFLAVRNDGAVSKAEEYIERIMTSKEVDMKSSREDSNQVTIHQDYHIDSNIVNRIIAKMAFNYLAYEKGIDFALEANFDPVRNWILTGTDTKQSFVDMIPNDNEQVRQLIPLLPDKAHYIVIFQDNNNINSIVGFYGETYTHVINLGQLEPGRKAITNPLVFICDWKNQKSEYTLLEHLSSIDDVY